MAEKEWRWQVRSAAVRATTAFLCDNDEDPHTLSAMQPLIPLVLKVPLPPSTPHLDAAGRERDVKVCEGVVVENQDDDSPLQCLGDLATSLPKTLKPHLNDVATLCLQVHISQMLDLL